MGDVTVSGRVIYLFAAPFELLIGGTPARPGS